MRGFCEVMRRLRCGKFVAEETGAVTIDWVALSAGILLLGVAVVYSIFNAGVAPLVGGINDTLMAVSIDLNVGIAPDMNGSGGSEGSDDPAPPPGHHHDH